MFELRYLKLSYKEIKIIFLVSSILSLLFSLSFIQFSGKTNMFFSTFFIFLFFLFILLFSRTVFMKAIAYRNGFELNLKQTYFDRFWIRGWDKLSYYDKLVSNKNKLLSKGIPMSIMAIVIYVFSLGIVIFPSIWNYDYKRIAHMHIGTRQKFEHEMGHMWNIEISDYRISKAYFTGFIYYFIVGIILKMFFSGVGWAFYDWITFILYWIAFFTILPIPGSEGYELWRINNFAWISAIIVLFLGMLSLLVFQKIFYVILVTAVSSVIVLLVIFWRRLMK